MALHILNFSIDNPHTFGDKDKVDADFEEVDSVVELVLEDVMQIENAIPEHHSKTPISHKMNLKKSVWLFEQPLELVFENDIEAPNYKVVLADTFYNDPLYQSPSVALFSPPPEV